MVLFVLYVVLSFESVDEILWCDHRIQQYFHMVLIVLYVVLTFESVDEILWCDYSNETSSAVLLHSTSHCLGFFKKEMSVIIYLFIYLFFTVIRNERVKREISVAAIRS